jgi:NAD-dependent dihydropyrimidine dehydrogenase PreA subunit
MYIDPKACTDCAACEPACPVSAIFLDSDVPAKWQSFISKNAAFFQ